MNFATALTVGFALALSSPCNAAQCTHSCSSEFVNNCVPFQNQGYEVCRDEIDGANMPMPLSNAGCVAGCQDTDKMAATKDDNGDTTTCSLGAEAFVANEQGSPITLCSEQICSLWSGRGTTACKVLMDVPSTCTGAAGQKCPLIFFFHGAGGQNSMWVNSVGPDIHDGTNDFIGIYPQGVDNQWNTGSQSGAVSEVDDVAFVVSIKNDILKKYFSWDGSFFAYGHSNGAALANKLAANGVGFHGIAAAASQLIQTPESSADPAGSSYLYNTIPNPVAQLIPMLSLHGDSDGTIPYDGGVLFGGPYVLYSEADSQRIYADLNGCTSDETYSETTVPAVTDSGVTSTATKYTYDACNVVGYKVSGGDHGVANSIDGKAITKVAMEFFKDVDGVVSSEVLTEDHSADDGAANGLSGVSFGAIFAALITALSLLNQ
ncbi:hypothetical protein TrVE_jg11350 [Triparma verrucosa]|uniref:Feruloyl esterase n=1 Tax=Triparma verrucosa TaxID=1606542 RepID=A0A9W7CEU9_9STRA|nr:hypothetical protein TrVE_jg11350 [Triparma verrucosa]